jgi:hypothetical protein
LLKAVQAIHAREKTAVGSSPQVGAAAGSAASSVATLTKDVIDRMVVGVDSVAENTLAHRHQVRCVERMIRIADAFEPLATTAKGGGALGEHAKAEGRKMLEKMSAVCWQIQAPEEDWKPKHEIRVQKAMVKLVFQYAHVFYDDPKELAQIFSNVIKQARGLNDSAANRAYDAQGQIVRRMEENLKEYPIETLFELADSITPQDIAAFSPKPLAGHTLVGHKTWRVGRHISVPNPGVEKFTKGLGKHLLSPYSPDAPDVSGLELLGEIPSFLVKSVDKAYQRVKNHVKEPLSGRDRMIHLMLEEALQHPGMTVDHLHIYLARILNTADIYDATRALPFGQWADFVRVQLPEADRGGVDGKRTELAVGGTVVETGEQPVEQSAGQSAGQSVEQSVGQGGGEITVQEVSTPEPDIVYDLIDLS